ncbi:hypothetical protein AWL63_18860 [Sphingomonas panacis]|uniref:Riboflavin synthase n=1 Tax=Sphingomonas panacis TaxID=1560345 RepID=A0A1B3ZE63_9SPHN|nr:riboflavin synthase [Sphingomonas panacis]AOH85693.1 hypothetical protein AWL63_18860 [Sphingomonas panacis]
MYSGIVQTRARVVGVDEHDGALNVTVQVGPDHLKDVKIGASIALDGVCMTVVDHSENTVTFNAVQATIDATNIGDRRVGDLLNFERSLRFGDENGGHAVSGHIYGVGRIASMTKVGRGALVFVEAPSDLMPFIFTKGFITVDGASLTVGRIGTNGAGFELNLIPETLRQTVFELRGTNARVNLEVDYQTVVIVQSINAAIKRQGQSIE